MAQRYVYKGKGIEFFRQQVICSFASRLITYRMHTDKILVIGACGQLGTELTLALREIYNPSHVIASDLQCRVSLLSQTGPFEKLDVLDTQRLAAIINKHQITQIYHLAAMLSATGEQNPKFAWKLNVNGLLNVLDMAQKKKLHKIFWPSSIAVFGPHTPSQQTPQFTTMDPNTVYGISKLAGERWCEYYFQKYGVDVRSLRYPGLISYKTPPGGGTTDYAIEIYHKALESVVFECFLSEDTYLPMMYMPDAIKATLQLMDAPSENIKIRSSYNVGAFSFSPKEITQAIQTYIPAFTITYKPDFRQQIANSWPNTIDDTPARTDWQWQPEYTLQSMTSDILLNLKKLKAEALV
jgi:nucleoside-diphosphate-sugar epimerase